MTTVVNSGGTVNFSGIATSSLLDSTCQPNGVIYRSPRTIFYHLMNLPRWARVFFITTYAMETLHETRIGKFLAGSWSSNASTRLLNNGRQNEPSVDTGFSCLGMSRFVDILYLLWAVVGLEPMGTGITGGTYDPLVVTPPGKSQ
jgi:hypothetical protein